MIISRLIVNKDKTMVRATSGLTQGKVTFKEWLVALGSLLMVAASLLVIRDNLDLGVTMLAFAGVCFATLSYSIFSKIRIRGLASLTEGVDGKPIRLARGRLALVAIGLLAIGGTQVYFEPTENQILFGIASGLVVMGSGLLVLVASSRTSKICIQLEPTGIKLNYVQGAISIP